MHFIFPASPFTSSDYLLLIEASDASFYPILRESECNDWWLAGQILGMLSVIWSVNKNLHLFLTFDCNIIPDKNLFYPTDEVL